MALLAGGRLTMMTVADVRDRFVAALSDVDGWRESPTGPGKLEPPKQKMDRLFAVLVPTTVAQGGQRQRRTEGLLVDSTLHVDWGCALTASALSNSYTSALEAEQALLVACMGISQEDCHILSEAASRTAEQGHARGTLVFRVVHRIPLQ